VVEDVGDIAHHRPGCSDIQVTEVRVRGDAKVVIADIAPANDCHRVVHEHGLVVHAVVDAIKIGNEIQAAKFAIGEGIEDSDLDVGMGIHGGDHLVLAGEVDVIYQHTYFYAAVGRLDQPLRQGAAGRIAFPDIDLHIQALLGQFGEGNARGECLASIADDVKP
jgi:hypothetical protein